MSGTWEDLASSIELEAMSSQPKGYDGPLEVLGPEFL